MHQTRIYCLWEMSSLLTSWAAQRNCYSSFWEALLVILQFIVCYHRTPRLGQGHPGTPGLWKECVVLGPWGSAGRCSPGTARAPESQGPQGPTLLSLPVPTWSCGSGVTASPPPAPCLSLTPHPGSLEGRRACPFPRLQPRWAECSPWSCGWSGPPAPPAPWLAPARVHFRDLLSDTQVSRGGGGQGSARITGRVFRLSSSVESTSCCVSVGSSPTTCHVRVLRLPSGSRRSSSTFSSCSSHIFLVLFYFMYFLREVGAPGIG